MNKKQLIMEKALELFAKQGIKETSVQQITEYCGISKGAFYLSFKSKDELILSIIDHFMQLITADLDYTVSNRITKDTLYQIFHKIFDAFLKHRDLAKFLMIEQTHSLNKELLSRMQYYHRKTDVAFLKVMEKIYGESINEIKYDLIYSIKGLINGYANIILFNSGVINLDLAAKSLVEKVDILAKNITIPFITLENEEMIQDFFVEEISKDELLTLLDTTLNEIEGSIEKESLLILKEHLIEPTHSKAIINGLIENIRSNPECKWLAYLLRIYFRINS
ncbi:TetR/AcrR family transcriptional regulator [Ornithinibacillus sp. 179-J 7C1 HS]|uniref:TetR/AcrR family transcriptional regulator n=1 Tax=Ornithinibacillus sp. 179-J 7C1 HS TaxID=3142384 RepID=UPI0039A276BA